MLLSVVVLNQSIKYGHHFNIKLERIDALCISRSLAILKWDDGNLISLDENKDKVESFLKFFARFSNMRTRKNKHELESYKIANSSVYGWLTEKCYNDDLFDSGNDTKWYEKDEESPAKKLKRLREAEKEAARLARPRESYDEDCDDDDDY